MRPFTARVNEQLDPRQQLANTRYTPPPQSTIPGLHPISIHQMAPPELTSDCSLLLIYRPQRIKGWVGLVGLETKDADSDVTKTEAAPDRLTFQNLLFALLASFAIFGEVAYYLMTSRNTAIIRYYGISVNCILYRLSFLDTAHPYSERTHCWWVYVERVSAADPSIDWSQSSWKRTAACRAGCSCNWHCVR